VSQELIGDSNGSFNANDKFSSEVWSIGVIFYILLTGNYLCCGESDKDLVEEITQFDTSEWSFLEEVKDVGLKELFMNFFSSNAFERMDKTMYLNNSFLKH